jgi:phosphotriesterase-related protein
VAGTADGYERRAGSPATRPSRLHIMTPVGRGFSAVHPWNRRIASSSERAHRSHGPDASGTAGSASKVPITTHTSGSARFEIPGGNLGAQHLDLFEVEGVDPGRVIIGHNDENADIRFLLSLARRGAYIQFDVIGKIHWLLDETRVELLARLADGGYLDRLLLSTDRCRLTELKARGGPGYDHLLRNFLPMLRQNGFDEAAIHQMLVDNPARILAIDAS